MVGNDHSRSMRLLRPGGRRRDLREHARWSSDRIKVQPGAVMAKSPDEYLRFP